MSDDKLMLWYPIWNQTERSKSLRTHYVNLITIIQNNRLWQSIIPTHHVYGVILYKIYDGYHPGVVALHV